MTDQQPQAFNAPPLQSDKSWYQKAGCVIPLVLVILAVMFLSSCTALIAAGAILDDKDDKQPAPGRNAPIATTTTSTTTAPAPKLYPERIDARPEDQEAAIPGSISLTGFTATVNAASFRSSLGDYDTKGYLIAEVTLENADTRSRSWNVYDWELQTPSGEVLDPGFTISTDKLGMGELVPGGKITGKVPFTVEGRKGDFYLIYKPDTFGSARGVWKVTL